MRRLAIGILLLFPFFCNAQRMQRATGTYTYVIPEDESFVVARQKAYNLCRIKILADTFGSSVSSSEILQVVDGEDRYLQIAESEVKGEWIRDVSEVQYVKSVINDHYVLTVTLSGEVRPLKRAQTDLQVKVLRNGTTASHVDTEFKSGDFVFLSFKAPISGYLLVYMTDYSMSQCMLPYPRQEVGSIKVKAGKDYVFFSPDYDYDGIENYDIQRFSLVTESETEQNRMYVIFSPNEFSKPSSRQDAGIDMLSFRDFQRWLSLARQRDRQMVVEEIDLTIQKK